MVYCVLCGNRSSRDSDVRYHAFPREKHIMGKWISFARCYRQSETWNCTKSSCICSNHFTFSDYRNLEGKRLISTAVPSVMTPSIVRRKRGPGINTVANCNKSGVLDSNNNSITRCEFISLSTKRVFAKPKSAWSIMMYKKN